MTSPFDPNFINDPAFQPAVSGDVNIIATVDSILQGLGYADPRNWKSDPEIVAALNIRPKGQIFLCNRYWRKALGRHSADTSATRFVLQDELQPEDYAQFFSTLIAPVILKLGV